MQTSQLFWIVTLANLFSGATLHAQSNARLAARAGTVEVMRGGTWMPANFGEAINSGERLRTGFGSSAAIDFGPGKIVTLSEGTEVEVRDSSSSPMVQLETGNIKVVSDSDIQVSTKETTLTSAEKPLDMEIGYRGDSLNLSVGAGAVRNGAMIIRGTEDVTKRTYTSGGRRIRPESTVVYPNIYFYPYVVYGNQSLVPNNSQNPPYLGYSPYQIIPPMTDPLRPPVHYPVNPFPTPPPRNQ